MQRWARAYRDTRYHAAVDTNNGTEAQNKLFKYSFLPRQKKIKLSSVINIIVEQYLPSCKQKYLFRNYQQLSSYRKYSSTVPCYLHNRPRTVIIHCLNRKAKSEKYNSNSVTDIQQDVGIFKVDTGSNQYTINFQEPSCTCKDWHRYHIPCKHFFTIFQYRDSWQWNQLPKSYLEGPYVSMDSTALTKQVEYIQLHEQHNDPEQQSDDHQCNTDNSQVNSDEPLIDSNEPPIASDKPSIAQDEPLIHRDEPQVNKD